MAMKSALEDAIRINSKTNSLFFKNWIGNIRCDSSVMKQKACWKKNETAQTPEMTKSVIIWPLFHE